MSNVVVVILVLVGLFVVGPIAMHLWGSMFAKGFFSNVSKYFKTKSNSDEQKEDK